MTEERASLYEVVPGSIYSGGGMTVRVLEVVTDEYGRRDVRVERLTGRGGLLKRPARPGVISMGEFRKFMSLRDLTSDDIWTQAIRERYGNA